MFLLVVVITVGLFLFQDEMKRLGNYGYLGAFLISLLTNATIILPMPSLILLFPIAAAFNPLYVGLAAGIGGAIGEMTAYAAGYSGSKLWQDNPNYLKAVAWLKKWGMLVVFVFSVTPLPLDIMGLAAGNLRLPWWKFFLPCWPGKTIKYIVLSFTAYWGWEYFINSTVLQTTLLVTGIGIFGTGALLVLALLAERWTWKKNRPAK